MWRSTHANQVFSDGQLSPRSGGSGALSPKSGGSGGQLSPRGGGETYYETRRDMIRSHSPQRRRVRSRSRSRGATSRSASASHQNGGFEASGVKQASAMRTGGMYLPGHNRDELDTSMSSMRDEEDSWNIHYLDETPGNSLQRDAGGMYREDGAEEDFHYTSAPSNIRNHTTRISHHTDGYGGEGYYSDLQDGAGGVHGSFEKVTRVPRGGGASHVEYREVRGDSPVRRSGSSRRTTTTTTYKDGGGGGRSYNRTSQGGAGGGGRTIHLEQSSGHVGDMWNDDLNDGESFAEYEQRSSGPRRGMTTNRTVHTERTSGGGGGDYDHWGGVSHGGASSSSRSRSMRQSRSGGMAYGGGSGAMQSSSGGMSYGGGSGAMQSSSGMSYGGGSGAMQSSSRSYGGGRSGGYTQSSSRSGGGGGSSAYMKSGSRSYAGGSRGFHSGDMHMTGGQGGGKLSRKYLQEVQHELDDRRNEWKDEIDKLSETFITKVRPTDGTIKKIKQSYVDTSSGKAIFKAHFDLRNYDQRDVKVEIENGRIIVVADEDESKRLPKMITKKFTQRVRLPHFSDERNARYFFEPGGILTVEVPLIYYFPPKDKRKDQVRHLGTKHSSKFFQTVRTSDGRKVMKMSIEMDPMINPDTIQVKIEGDRRIKITADGHREPGRSTAGMLQFSKEVKIPKGADLDHVQSTIDSQGTLWIEVPVQDMHVSYDATESDATITRETGGQYVEQDETLTRDGGHIGSSRHHGGRGGGKETAYSSTRTYTSGGGGGEGGGSRTLEYSSRGGGGSGSRSAQFSSSGGGHGAGSSSRTVEYSSSKSGRVGGGGGSRTKEYSSGGHGGGQSSRTMEYSSGGHGGGQSSRTTEYSKLGGRGGGGRTVEYSRRVESQGPVQTSRTTERVSSSKSGSTVINI